jgi:hypothetical protein
VSSSERNSVLLIDGHGAALPHILRPESKSKFIGLAVAGASDQIESAVEQTRTRSEDILPLEGGVAADHGTPPLLGL